MNDFQQNMPDTAERTRSERHLESIRQQGGIFVEAVRVTRMPMLVTDATLPGNPITFANNAFIKLSGYTMDELLGQDPHFMNGEETDPRAIEQYEAAMRGGRMKRSKFCNTAKMALRSEPCCSPARWMMGKAKSFITFSPT